MEDLQRKLGGGFMMTKCRQASLPCLTVERYNLAAYSLLGELRTTVKGVLDQEQCE